MPNSDPQIIAVFTGSFDPVTFGHLDVLRRGARVFREVIVGVGTNPDKEELFTPQERLDLLVPHIQDMPNVRAATYSGLTIDFVRQHGAHVLLRGIRDMADLSNEVQLATLNRLIGGIETVFMLASDQHVLTSSRYIRQIMEMGGSDPARIAQLVPPNVVAALIARFSGRPSRDVAPRLEPRSDD
jgi:pantetheine-phosphate adenylyltransferase